VSAHVTAPRVVAAAVLVVVAVVLVWNIDHFLWIRSYDASASERYAYILGHEHRLPRESETDVWHNPPLFFLLAEVLYIGSDHLGASGPGAFVQALSMVSVLATLLLTMLIAQELFPRSRWLPVLALVLAATTPVLIRAGILFHPEPLATALTTAGLYVGVRTLARGTFSWRAGLLAGVLLGLANLTRTWALGALGAVLIGFALAALRRRDHDSIATLVAAAAAAVVLMTPWLVAKTVLHGNPLAYSRPVASQWLEHGRPLRFWLPPSPVALVRQPYNTRFQNRLLPVVYADWWGDYWRTYRIPNELHNDPPKLPAEYARPLQRQVAVGWIVGVAALVGLVALTLAAVRRRDLALGTVLLSLGLLAVSFVGFLVQYPKLDGDNMKALYVLDAAPVLAIAAAFAFGRLAARGTAWLVAVGVLLAIVIVPTVQFLVLPG
jgi:4-amino-4-deoxy-L-arabinose transferase-like glycosyltransferase